MSQSNLIEALKSRREMLDLTQETLSILSGVALRTIRLLESGKGNPTLLTVTKLADVMGMRVGLQIKTMNETE
jgi:DNA-binding XRE family transcriptional regulator